MPSPSPELRVLVVTQLFPSAADPTNAVFNRLQLVALSRRCRVHLNAVIPWFPGARLLRRWSIAGRNADVPREEIVDGLRVLHPRVLFLPRVGPALSPALYAASLWPSLRRLRGEVDAVLGCWATPDGVAAIELARRLGAASVVKVHGTDLNVLARRPAIRRVLERALPRVDRLVAVNRPLAEVARELGVPERKIAVVRNGLDRETFRPRDRGAARAELGLPAGGRWIVYVGLFHRMKGLGELATAFDLLAPRRPDVNLALVGEGPDAALAREAQARHPGRVVLTGPLPAAGVARWMAAADLVTLPSWAEGTPNVILEAFASGRRVVATRVGGIPDLVRSEVFGALVPPRDPAALADALEHEVSVDADPEALAQVIPSGWDESASRLLEVLQEAVAERAAAGVMSPA